MVEDRQRVVVEDQAPHPVLVALLVERRIHVKIRCPVLALFGERDTNVLPEKNAALWEAALRKGGHSDYTVRVLRRANHILLDVPTSDLKELPASRGFVPEYRATLEEWLDRHLGTSAGRR